MNRIYNVEFNNNPSSYIIVKAESLTAAEAIIDSMPASELPRGDEYEIMELTEHCTPQCPATCENCSGTL